MTRKSAIWATAFFFVLAAVWLVDGYFSGRDELVDISGVEDYRERSFIYLQYARLQQNRMIPSCIFASIALCLLVSGSRSIKRSGERLRPSVTFLYRNYYIFPLIFFFVSSFICWYVIRATPRVFDAFNYYFQAINISHGRFSAPIPADAELFRFPFIMMYNGKWFGSVYPGYPFLLAVGILAGIPWLVNPILGALSLLVIQKLGLKLYGRKMCLAVGILGILSPFYLIQSAIFMSHPTALLFMSLAFYFFTEWDRSQRSRQALLCGISLGMVLITRPQVGFTFGFFPAVYGVIRLFKGRYKLKGIFLIVIPIILFFSFNAYYNFALTGKWFDNPRYRVSPYRRLGFGEDIGFPLPGGGYSGHDLKRGLQNAGANLELLNQDLFCWGGGYALGLPVILMFAALFGKSRNRYDFIFFGIMITTVGLYIAYFTPSPNFGPRYYLEAMPAVLFLAVRGGSAFKEGIKTIKVKTNFPFAFSSGLFIIASASFLFLQAFFLGWPIHLTHYGKLPVILEKSDVQGLKTLKKAVLFVDPIYFRGNVFLWNDPRLTGPVIFIPGLEEENFLERIKKTFPEREYYRLDRIPGTDRFRCIKLEGVVRPVRRKSSEIVIPPPTEEMGKAGEEEVKEMPHGESGE